VSRYVFALHLHYECAASSREWGFVNGAFEEGPDDDDDEEEEEEEDGDGEEGEEGEGGAARGDDGASDEDEVAGDEAAPRAKEPPVSLLGALPQAAGDETDPNADDDSFTEEGAEVWVDGEEESDEDEARQKPARHTHTHTHTRTRLCLKGIVYLDSNQTVPTKMTVEAVRSYQVCL